MKTLLLLFLFFLTSPGYLSAQNFDWARQKRGENILSAKGESIVLDAAANVYSTGSFLGTVDFDPGTGIFNMGSFSVENAYISKLDSAGNFIWSKQFGGTLNTTYVRGKAITLDAAGNIYVTGEFSSKVDFDPGSGQGVLDASIKRNAFVCKFTANGNFVWVRQLGESGSATGTSITTDAAGNVYSTGYFEDMGDFDPGPGVFQLSGSDNTCYISKLDASGNFVWAKQLGGGILGGVDVDMSIAQDAAGNIIVGGSFFGSSDFDPGPAVQTLSAGNTGARDIFIIKLNPAGNLTWLRQMGGNEGDYCLSLSVDVSGNIYTTGYFNGSADFDPGQGTYTLVADINNYAGYISKLDANGNFVWAKPLEGNGTVAGLSISLDNASNVYTTGHFVGTADFDPGLPINNLSAAGIDDIFISKLDLNGSFVWAVRMGGVGSAVKGMSSALDAVGNVFTTGQFGGAIDFDPGTGIHNLISVGGENIFVSKLSHCTNGTFANLNVVACSSYLLNGQNYTSSGTYTQTLTNTSGCDSIITLNLTINQVKQKSDVIACINYSWNGQQFTSSGSYSDTLVAANGCDSIILLNLTITKPVSETIEMEICPGKSFEGHSTTGVYTQHFIAAGGCDSTRTVKLTVSNNCPLFNIPTAFTPNGDDQNELFKPTINQDVKEYSFVIFNRYGQRVFETQVYPFGWDGRFNGKEQPVGSYIYFINYKTGNNQPVLRKGTFLLVR